MKTLKPDWANSGGQLVGLFGLRLVSSDGGGYKCLLIRKVLGSGRKKRRTANVQNNTVALTSEEGL